ncbi:ATP phosphoribosyltransferase regulatory subunit [Chachezhania antarctica]|uniref:ATP phosphoribosyltransferase regulatory subunit n=1 Tax=Chachezhania antarctica TaxID=2340860 RepID=UPI000EB03A94|nr:ATP phosphoribosyltransferase regulatory subunit [Chachezhania antarctica]
MGWRAAELARAARLKALFETAGAKPVETSVLQPADLLLDLYGEDMRARAYVTWDALRGELMLRPDFTVPVVQMHMEGGADPARYTYSGEVFRRQEQDPSRANEYVQVGYEVFDRVNPAAADAEVFALIAHGLSELSGLRAVTGDIGILTAAVEGLETSSARKAALMRHLWRPRRFRALLDRYSGKTPMPPSRTALLQAATTVPATAPEIGRRQLVEVESRIETLKIDSATPPIGGAALSALNALLAVRETMPFAMEQLRDIAIDLPAISPALDRLEARVAALRTRGVDVDRLEFEASYGRTSMEYYDGFVFGFVAEARPDLPPVATGGRYDALTRRLGQGAEIPAVGGVIRPGVMLELGAV